MSDYSRLLEILKHLVAFQTYAGNNQAISDCYKYIEDQLSSLALFGDRYESNGHESLVLTTQPTKRPRVLLQAHIDVVPGYRRQYRLIQKNSVLYGRGVYDMKFGAACFVRLLEDLGTELSHYDIGLMLTADEEINGLNGVKYLLDQGYSAEVCILPDSGDEWNVEATSKGFAIAEITAKGKSAHGSRPWEGDNAASKLMQLVCSMEDQFPYSDRLGATCSLTRLDAGPAYNQIPGEAMATFDIRYPDEVSLTAIQTKIRQLCAAEDVEVLFVPLASSIIHNVNSPYVEIWQAITEKLTGHEPGYTHSFAASDARYLVPANITTISSRPPGGGHHGAEEWLSEKDYYLYYDVLKQFILQTARVSN